VSLEKQQTIDVSNTKVSFEKQQTIDVSNTTGFFREVADNRCEKHDG
jgi:hypothetical protein